MFKVKSYLNKPMSKQLLVLSMIIIITSSLVLQDASASILSASMKNPPQATADLLTLNNTSGTHLWWVDSTGKMFAASNADFHSSSTIFDSSSIKIRNPASTFAYTLTGGAIAANRTLNIPVLTGTDTLAVLGLPQTFTNIQTISVGAGGLANVFNMLAPIMANGQKLYYLIGTNSSNNGGFYFDYTQGGTGSTRLFGFQSNENGVNSGFVLDALSNVIIHNAGNVTTSATDGFIVLPKSAGTPTGVPTQGTGALEFDGTHNKLCVYNSGWKCVTLS